MDRWIRDFNEPITPPGDDQTQEACYDCGGHCEGFLAGGPCTTPRSEKPEERWSYCDCGTKLLASDPHNRCEKCEALLREA